MHSRPYLLTPPLPHSGNGDEVFGRIGPVEEKLLERFCREPLTPGLRFRLLSTVASGALALRNAPDRAICGVGTFKLVSGKALCRTAARALPAAGLRPVRLQPLSAPVLEFPHGGTGQPRPAFAAAWKSSLCLRQSLFIGEGIGADDLVICFGLRRGLLAIFWQIA